MAEPTPAQPQPPAPTSPPVVQRRLVVFENGAPVVVKQAFIPKAKIQQLALQALSLPYTSPEDELAIELGLKPSDYYGRPIIEVMILKASLGAARSGDIDMIEKVLDRAIGKPKTSSESVNLQGSYEDFLKAAKELMDQAPAPRGPAPIEVEVAPADGWEALQ